MKFWVACAAIGAMAAAPAYAQTRTVSASDPAGMVTLLEEVGYEPELSKDSFGDPEIELVMGDWNASIMFYGCDEDTHDKCDSIQLIGGFDTQGSVSAEQALAISKSHRYSQVTIDDEGDVWVRWDMLIGDDFPAPVFLRHLRAFASSLDNAGEMVFPDEAEAEAEAMEEAVEEAAE